MLVHAVTITQREVLQWQMFDMLVTSTCNVATMISLVSVFLGNFCNLWT